MINKNFKLNFNNIQYNSGFNSFLNLTFIAIQAPLVIFTLGICERTFSSEQFGDIVLYFSILNILIYADFGRSRVITSRISSLKKSNIDKFNISLEEAIYSIKTSTANIFLKTNLICFGISLLLLTIKTQNLGFLSDFIDLKYLLIILFIPISFLFACLKGFFEGIIKFKEANILKIVNGWTTYIPFLCMAFSGIYNPLLVLFISLILKIIMGYYFWITGFRGFNNKNLRKQKSKLINSFENNLNRDSIWSFQSNILSPLIMNGDKFIVSAILGLPSVAIYGPTVDIALRCIMLPASFSSAIIPKISKGIAENSKNYLPQIRKYNLINILISIFNFIILSTCFKYFLRFIFSYNFAERADSIVLIISFGILFNSLAFFPYSYLSSISRFKLLAKIHFTDFVFFLIFLVFLSFKYGIVGSAIAWSIRAFVDFILMYYYFLKNIKKIKTN